MVTTATLLTGGGGGLWVCCQMITPVMIRPMSTSAMIAKMRFRPFLSEKKLSLKTCWVSTLIPYDGLINVFSGDTDLGHPRFTTRIHDDHQILKVRLLGARDADVGVRRILAQQIGCQLIGSHDLILRPHGAGTASANLRNGSTHV